MSARSNFAKIMQGSLYCSSVPIWYTPRRRFNAHAFSLVELVIVIAIIAVLSAIAVPRFADASARHRVLAAGNRVAADVLVTREKARATSQTTSLRFYVGTGAYKRIDQAGLSSQQIDIALEPYLARIENTSFVSNNAEISGFGLPLASGRILVRVGTYFVIVSLRADGSVAISDLASSSMASPTVATISLQLVGRLETRIFAVGSGIGNLGGAGEEVGRIR